MELLRFGEKGLSNSPHRRKKWILLIAISGVVSGYGAYKVYHLPSVTRKRRRLMKILGAFLSVAELISESAEAMTVVSRDMKEFLTSDADEIPNSFKQIAKIANSKEFADSLSRVSQAVTIGVSRGYKSESCSNVVDSEPSVVDRVVDKAFSKAGTGFFSVVVGSFAKNLVLGFRSNEGVTRGDDDTVTPRWLSLLCDERSREVLAECIERFTSTAVGVYLDKTMDINAFDQIFEGMTNPKHQDSVKDVLVSVCNGAIETVVRTSHEVFTTSKSSAVVEEESNGGWTDAISNTLAVPSNRRFMFDVTGRVTLETTKSIIGFLMLKTLQGFRRSFDVVQGEVTERGRQVVGYVGAKASVIVTVWLALYLHIINRCVRNSPIGVSQHF
ncbi:protein PHLOEM PROTEIN 2-LIKE A10-like [Brassica napus]|uniref:protein PHLOEM PROTEIN 2-LIKE A10-like n=1 Tax=Brassica napus TaxID=3708 RepID=UPI0006AAC8D8|nr:protein PHLOEM PROTEIN 2-LIKE A10-like [Brassica napus]